MIGPGSDKNCEPSKFARGDRNIQECANLCFNTWAFNVGVKYQDCSHSFGFKIPDRVFAPRITSFKILQVLVN